MFDSNRATPVPVTILADFVGAGKTALLNRILGELSDKRDNGARPEFCSRSRRVDDPGDGFRHTGFNPRSRP